jgi:ABC-type polysaccharide/polyol phosphate export permease
MVTHPRPHVSRPVPPGPPATLGRLAIRPFRERAGRDWSPLGDRRQSAIAAACPVPSAGQVSSRRQAHKAASIRRIMFALGPSGVTRTLAKSPHFGLVKEMLSNWNNLIARRDLLQELVVTELKTSSAGTRLGWIWWLLDPLLMMLIYSLVVGILLGRGRAEYAPYPIFILCALITWKHFSTSAGKATQVLRDREALIKSVPFPTMVLPLSIVLSALMYFFFGFFILMSTALIWPNAQHSGNYLALSQVPLLMTLQVFIIAGLCLPLSCLGVLIRDLGPLMTHLLRVGFYISPGLFGIDLIEKALTNQFGQTYGPLLFSVYMLNPFAILISGYRDCVFYGEFLPVSFWLVLIIEAAIFFVIGNLIYQHYDRRIIKFL